MVAYRGRIGLSKMATLDISLSVSIAENKDGQQQGLGEDQIKNQRSPTMSKRKIIKSSRSMTASSGGTTQCQADWTINDTTEYVYAIRVMTTKKGKKRKRKAWATRWVEKNHWWVEPWRINDTCSLVWQIWGGRADLFLNKIDGGNMRPKAEAAIGCKCKVVKIALQEVEE